MNLAEYRAELSFAEGFNACLTKYASLVKRASPWGALRAATKRYSIPGKGLGSPNLFGEGLQSQITKGNAVGIRKGVASGLASQNPYTARLYEASRTGQIKAVQTLPNQARAAV
jgi:hypothetical protein